jgi:hypothetical protein
LPQSFSVPSAFSATADTPKITSLALRSRAGIA